MQCFVKLTPKNFVFMTWTEFFLAFVGAFCSFAAIVAVLDLLFGCED